MYNKFILQGDKINKDSDEQGPEMRGLLSQVDDETGSYCVDENVYA